MISFLNSGILFLASAIAVPVLIYLFAKKKPNKLIFSSIRFIKQSQQKQKRKINLKNLLLLIIRILIILFTILALSRPAIKSKYLDKSSKHPKTGIAVIIDNSYSMNYLVDTQTELEKAKLIAHQINEMIGDDDNTILLTLNNNWNQIQGEMGFGKLNKELIDEIEISAQIVPIQDILKQAEEKLITTHLPNKEIYFITDMQKQELPDKLEFPTFFIPTSDVFERNNISCVNAEVKHEIVGKTMKKQIEVTLVNHSKNDQQDVVYELFIDGNTVAQKATDLLPEQNKKLKFAIEMQTPGWHSGFASVKNERLLFDNKSYFSFYIDNNPQVAVITDLSQLPVTLGSILEIYTDDITMIADDNFNFNELQKFDNIMIYKKSELSEKLRAILTKLKENNKSILFIADKDLPKAQQKFAADYFDCEFEQFSAKNANINKINKFHPITRLLSAMDNVVIRDFWNVSSKANTLINTSSSPVAIEHDNSILWLFDVQSFASPFLLDPLFPVFAYNSLEFSAQNKTDVYKIGNKVALKTKNLILPGGTEIILKNNYFFPTDAGNYINDDQVFSVNIDAAESDYERLSDLKQKNLHLLDADWQNNILNSRYGFELWKYLLLAVLLLFILEMLIVKSEERKIT